MTEIKGTVHGYTKAHKRFEEEVPAIVAIRVDGGKVLRISTDERWIIGERVRINIVKVKEQTGLAKWSADLQQRGD